jgi:hypothetical protein
MSFRLRLCCAVYFTASALHLERSAQGLPLSSKAAAILSAKFSINRKYLLTAENNVFLVGEKSANVRYSPVSRRQDIGIRILINIQLRRADQTGWPKSTWLTVDLTRTFSISILSLNNVWPDSCSVMFLDMKQAMGDRLLTVRCRFPP